MKIIKKDLILTKDTKFDESIKVEGNIKGYFNLTVAGDLECRNLECRNLECRNLECWNLECRNLECWNLECWNIIYCEKVTKAKSIKAKILIKNRSKLKMKEWKK